MPGNPTCIARLVEWNQEKGFGFLEHDGKRLLLHAHDFVVLKRRVRAGDEIRFTVGHDHDGNACAKNARHADKGLKPVHLLVLAALVVAPSLAIQRLSQTYDFRIILGGVAFIGALTFLVNWEDKRRARAASWQVPANTMHLMELLGGWPVAYFAQRLLRHKRGGSGYQLTFWLIVALYQFVAIDYLRDWPLCSAARQGVEQVMKNK